jgi:hypothetical protein
MEDSGQRLALAVTLKERTSTLINYDAPRASVDDLGR